MGSMNISLYGWKIQWLESPTFNVDQQINIKLSLGGSYMKCSSNPEGNSGNG